MRKFDPRHAPLFFALALFYFVFLEATLFFQVSAEQACGLTGLQVQLPIHGASAVGLLAFAAANRFVGEKARPAFVAICGLVGIVSLTYVATGTTVAELMAAGVVAFFLIGVAGGAVYWATCANAPSIRRFATFIGASHGLGVLAQIPFFSLTPNRLGEAVLLSAAIVAMCALIVRIWPANSALDGIKSRQAYRAGGHLEEPVHAGWRISRMTARTATAMLLLLIVLFAVLFNTLHGITSGQGEWTSQYTDMLPRVLLALGGFAGGWLFDLRRSHYMGLTMLWISVLTVTAALCVQSGMPAGIGSVVYYLGSGAFVTFYTATFVWIARQLRFPVLWSGMGRVANNLIAIALSTPAAIAMQTSNPAALTALMLPLLIVANALLFLTGMMEPFERPRQAGNANSAATENAVAGDLNSEAAEGAIGGTGNPVFKGNLAGENSATEKKAASRSETHPAAEAAQHGGTAGSQARNNEAAEAPTLHNGTEVPPAPSQDTATQPQSAAAQAQTPDQRCADFAKRYALTPRETEVLKAVTADDRPLKQIAADLGISLRVVQRHLTSLYSKTSTQSRIGLTKRFWE